MNIFKLIATATFAILLFVVTPITVLADISASESPIRSGVTGVNTTSTSSADIAGAPNTESIINSNQLAQAGKAGSGLTWLWWTILVVILVAIFTYLYKKSRKIQ